MDGRDLESLFECFRARGDIDALAEVFDRVAPRLLEVARHLSRDEARAEDLVQGTFVAAIEGAKSFDGERELVAWLIGILANRAKQARERGLRRPDPERLAEPSAIDPVERAEVAEFAAALDAALAQVPEAYRDVLRIHLAEARKPKEIARQLDREPGLVRVQLHRGFQHLRRVLPPGFALGGAVVMAPPRGMAAVREMVLGEAVRSPVAVASTAGTGLLLGGALMSKQLGIGLVTVLAGALLWFGWRGGDGLEGPSEPIEHAPVTAELPAAAVEETVALGDPAESLRVAIEEDSAAVADDPYGSLTLHLHWADGTPAEQVRLRLKPRGESRSFQDIFHSTTDAAGEIVVDRIHEGRVNVSFDRCQRQERFEVERGRHNEVKLEVPRGVDVVGRIVDGQDVPVNGARIWTDGGDWLGCASPVGSSGPDGSFLLRSLDLHSRIFATAPREGASIWVDSKDLETDGEGRRLAELQLGGTCAAAEGTVTDSAGDPVAGARVAILCHSTRMSRNRRRAPFPSTLTDERGEWRLDGLVVGRADVLVSAPRFALFERRLDLEDERDNRIDASLNRGFTVRGKVTMADGSPGAKVGVTVERGSRASQFHPVGTSTDEAGEYVLENVSAGEVTLTATGDTQRTMSTTKLTGRVGDELSWNVEFGGGNTITGYAIDEETGGYLPGWEVRASCPSNPITEMTTTIGAGRFTLSGLLDEPYDITLVTPGPDPQARAYVQGVRPGPEDVVLVAWPEPKPSAFVLGRVLGPDGVPVRPTKISARQRDGRGSVRDVIWSEGERFKLGPLVATRYRVYLSFDDLPGLAYELELGEGEEHDLGDIQLERPGQVELTLRGPNGEALAEHSTVYLRWPDIMIVSVLETEDGFVFESDPMREGTYRLAVTSSNLALTRPCLIEVHPGETTTMEPTLAAGHYLGFFISVPEGEELPNELRFLVRNEAGEVLVDETREPSTQQGLTFLMFTTSLPQGNYTYSGTSKEGWAAKGTCSVTAEMEEWATVDVELFRE